MLKFLDDKGEVSNISGNNVYNSGCNNTNNNNNYAEDFVNQNSFDNDIISYACKNDRNNVRANKTKGVNAIISKNSKFKEVLLLLDNNNNKQRTVQNYNRHVNAKYNSTDPFTKYKNKIKSLTPKNITVKQPLQPTRQNKISFQIKQIYNDIQSFSKQNTPITKLNIPIGGGKSKLSAFPHRHQHHVHINPKTNKTKMKVPLYRPTPFFVPKHSSPFINTKEGIKSWILNEKTRQCNSYYLEKKQGMQTLFGNIKQSSSCDRLPKKPAQPLTINILTTAPQQNIIQSYLHTQRNFYKTQLALFDKQIPLSTSKHKVINY